MFGVTANEISVPEVPINEIHVDGVTYPSTKFLSINYNTCA
jgi:hypothetical protein